MLFSVVQYCAGTNVSLSDALLRRLYLVTDKTSSVGPETRGAPRDRTHSSDRHGLPVVES